jgi:hypothetical protein
VDHATRDAEPVRDDAAGVRRLVHP